MVLGGIVTVAVIMIATWASPYTPDNTAQDRGLSMAGYFVTLAALWASSRHRAEILWRTIFVGLIMQFILGIFVMKSPAGVGFPQVSPETLARNVADEIQSETSSDSFRTWHRPSSASRKLVSSSC